MPPNNVLKVSYISLAKNNIYHGICCLIVTSKYYKDRSYDSYFYPTFLEFFSIFLLEYGSIHMYRLCFEISDHSLISTLNLIF